MGFFVRVKAPPQIRGCALDLEGGRRLNPAMKLNLKYIVLTLMVVTLSACSTMPKLFWDTKEGTGQPSSYAGEKGSTAVASRPPLALPPELRAKLELPMAEQVGSKVTSGETLPDKYRKAVKGKAVALDGKVYAVSTSQLFSAVVDAMTSLNLPVVAVDSPSGIITTDWVRKGSNTPSTLSMFGGAKAKLARYRFVIRVFRMASENETYKSRLDVRILSQVFSNRHWVNKEIRRKETLQIFSAVEEQLKHQAPVEEPVVEKPSEAMN